MAWVASQLEVSNLDKKLKEQMLDIEGYRLLESDQKDPGPPGKLQSFDDVPCDAVAYKTASVSKTAGVDDKLNPGKKKRVSVDCTVIFTFSPTGQKQDRAGLEQAGFGAVICKKPACAEEEMEAPAVLSAYRSLNKVEECFRIMKSSFSLHPMYVSKEECIEGHVTICVIALVMLRLLQMRLKELGFNLRFNKSLPSPVTIYGTFSI